MIKGCNKRVIVMKDTGNEMIEEAFFILKPEASRTGISESELVKHANRILDKSMYGERLSSLSVNVSKKKEKSRLFPFFSGVVLGAVIMAGVLLII